MRKPKATPEEIKDMLQRFQKDSERRRQYQSNIDSLRAQYEKQDESISKKLQGGNIKQSKMSKEASDKLYERLMNAQREATELIAHERVLRNEKKDKEEQKELRKFNSRESKNIII